jgi:hypothetical protein
MDKQATDERRKHVTLMTCHKLDIMRRLEIDKSEKRLWLSMILDCQLSVI